MTEAATSSSRTVLVVGASGNTGKHVVRQLLDSEEKVDVRVIVRNADRFFQQLSLTSHGKSDDRRNPQLQVVEASLLEMTSEEVAAAVRGVEIVVSCLGHTMDYEGLLASKTRRLVTHSVQLILAAVPKPVRLILMNSDGVNHPLDPPRPWLDRTLLWLCAALVSPHADNMEAAQYLYDTYQPDTGNEVEWITVRPTDLVDSTVATEVVVFDRPGPLISPDVVSRINVARFVTDCVRDPAMWEKYKYAMPVLHNKKEEPIPAQQS
jgi:nucleoside-diphosphate-sugar epimerase